MKTPKELLPIKALAKRDLFYFTHYVLGYDKMVERVHGPICKTLEDLSKRRVNITMPRKWFKSTLGSIAYPLWRAVNDPNITMLLAMNRMGNAAEKLDELKNLVMGNQCFRALFPEVIPDTRHTVWGAEAATLKRTSLTGTPTFQIAGAGTMVTSKSVDEVMMDDLLCARSNEPTGREILPGRGDVDKAIRWHRSALSLLKDPATGRLLNIGTRWAQDDLVSYVLSTSEEYRENNFELTALDRSRKTEEFPLGTPTMPENYTYKTLMEIREHEGSTIFHLWYLNEPIDPAELIFKLDPDRNFYDPTKMPSGWAEGLRKYTTLDLAVSHKAQADNSAIVTIGVDEHNVKHVLDLQYGKFSPMEIVDRLFATYRIFRPRVIGIESVAAQALLPRILPHFMRERDMAMPIREINRHGGESKQHRIMLELQPWVEQGMFKLPVGGAKPLETEMRDYRVDNRRGGHDDALDAAADAVHLSLAKRAEVPQKKRTRYTPEFWSATRDQLYSFEDDIEKTLASDELDRLKVGHRVIPYSNN